MSDESPKTLAIRQRPVRTRSQKARRETGRWGKFPARDQIPTTHVLANRNEASIRKNPWPGWLMLTRHICTAVAEDVLGGLTLGSNLSRRCLRDARDKCETDRDDSCGLKSHVGQRAGPSGLVKGASRRLRRWPEGPPLRKSMGPASISQEI